MKLTLERLTELTETAPAHTVAAPLTDREGDALLTQSASLERTLKVKQGIRSAPESRAWSRGGRVD